MSGDFKQGDTVRLEGFSSPGMEVVKVIEQEGKEWAIVVWFDKWDRLNEAKFETDLLQAEEDWGETIQRIEENTRNTRGLDIPF